MNLALLGLTKSYVWIGKNVAILSEDWDETLNQSSRLKSN